MKGTRRSVLLATGVIAVVGAGSYATHRVLQTHREIVSSIPPRPKAQAEQGILTDKLNDEESRARSFFHGPSGLRTLARVYQANGFLAEASLAYRGLLRTESATSHDIYLFACILGDSGQLDEAAKLIQRVTKNEPLYLPAKNRLAEVLSKLNQSAPPAEVEQTNRARGPKVDPWLDELLDECVDPYSLRVAASMRANDSPNVSVELLKRAIAFAPNDAATYRQLGKLLRDQERPNEARPYLDRAVELDPSSPESWSFLADLLNAQRDFSAADKIIEAGLGHCPNSSSLHLLRGRQLRREGQFELAAAEFIRVCELRPQEIDGRIDLAGIYLRMSRWAETEAELLKALKIEPDEPGSLGALTRFYIFRKNESAASSCMERVHRQKRMKPEMVQALEQAFSETFQASSGK